MLLTYKENVHSTQMYIPLKPLFSRHKGIGVQFTDEPTGNLDTKTTYEMMDLITGMAQKNHQTLVIVTHDQELAEYADRIVVLQDGKIEKIQKRIREKKENVYE